METFEALPDQTPGVQNPYKAVVLPGETYGQISEGYVEFNGKAFVVPRIPRISEERLQDIGDDTGVQIHRAYSTSKATHFTFNAEFEEDSDEDGDQEVVAAFRQLVNILGRTACE